MRIFISWSKEPSQTIAQALRDWLPDVIQSVEPWMSSTDVVAGARWSGELAQTLAASKLGIICVTPQNQAEPWLNFEAGALAKTLDGTLVCPYLINMRPSDLKGGPLTQFQAKTADEGGTFELVEAINRTAKDGPLPKDRLRRLFDRAWPDLEKKLKSLPPAQKPPTHRSTDELLEEVLLTVRDISREMNGLPPDRALLEEVHSDVRGLQRDVRGMLAASDTKAEVASPQQPNPPPDMKPKKTATLEGIGAPPRPFAPPPPARPGLPAMFVGGPPPPAPPSDDPDDLDLFEGLAKKAPKDK